MSERTLHLDDRRVYLLDSGAGEPLLYFHGFADVHGAVATWLPFHQLLQQRRVLAAAHPGCASSTGLSEIDSVEDLVFHYLDVLDALGLDQVDLVGTCIGGWVAVELAVRHPQRVRRLALIGAPGLYVPGAPIADLFMLSQSKNGGDHSDLRALLFRAADAPVALQMFPDGKAALADEVLRYQALTFAGRIGWSPPYLYDPKLRARLRRVTCPLLAIWGADDRMVPLAHGRAYAEGVPQGRLEVLEGAGHSVHLERPVEVARLVADFLG